MITQENLKASRLWAAAEGRPIGMRGERPVYPTREQRFRAQIAIAESIAAGEFPTQILPDVKRTLVTAFESIPRVTPNFTTRLTVDAIDVAEKYQVASFGDQTNIPALNQGETFVPGTLPRIGPREKYPQIGMTATEKEYKARKIGEAFGIDWEAIVRSRGAKIDIMRTAFETFGRHAGNTEEVDIFRLLVDSGGFRTGAGEALNDAIPMTSNADLWDPEDFAVAIALANTAVLTVGTSGTTSTVPVNYTDFAILATPENAPRIKAASQAKRITRNPGVSSGTSWEETVDFGGTVEVYGVEWLKKLWPSIGKGWIMVPVVSSDDLPILASVYLDGYEEPSVWIKDSNARQVGGGAVNPLTDGDFDSDAVETKVRHVHGGQFLWTDGIVYSTGANS
jgi:hypothetical protein